MGSARVALPGAVSSSATVPPVPITKVLAGADRLRAPPAVIVQFDNGRGVGGSAAACGHTRGLAQGRSDLRVLGHPRCPRRVWGCWRWGRGSDVMVPTGNAVAGLAWCARTAEEVGRVRE